MICGFGRTGNGWGCETFGIGPDLMTFAKGMTSGYVPLGGVMVSDRVANAVTAYGGFNHGYTYSGHPVAAAVAIANINILRDEKIIEQVASVTGPYLSQKFAVLIDHPLVGDAETCGFMAGLVLIKLRLPMTMFDPSLNVGMVCRSHCFSNGLIMRVVSDRMIIAPPLITTCAQIDEMMKLIHRCLDLTYDDVKSRGWLT